MGAARQVRASSSPGPTAGVDQNTGAFTAEGKRSLVAVERAWDRYVALEPDPPDDVAASFMVQAFSSAGLDKPEKAVRAHGDGHRRARRERSNLYSQLAVLAYQAGQTRKGDLAADKAVELAPASGPQAAAREPRQRQDAGRRRRGRAADRDRHAVPEYHDDDRLIWAVPPL